MSLTRLVLVSAAVLAFGVGPARAQYPSMAPYGAPTQFQNPWGMATPYYPYGGYAPYGMSPYSGAGWNGGLSPYQQSGVKLPRMRETLSPAITYREFFAYEVQQTALNQSKAKFTVNLPATAILTINDKETTQSGMVRTFVTPPFEGIDTYSFVFRASWKDELGTRTQEVTIQGRPGMSYNVTFPKPKSKDE